MASSRPSHVAPPRLGDQHGMALITVMMVMMLVSALMVGFVAAIVAENRASGLDRDQTQAYAAAHAGLEKLTSDLSGLFTTDFSPIASQVSALTATPPVVTNFQYVAPTGGSGYQITFIPDASGNPAPADPTGTVITAGPYQGFRGILTPYDITVTARSVGGAEVRMRRTLQTIAVPVFQFGVFSDSDLTFFAGDDFDFGGRAHTNGNMFLAELVGQTLSMSDRVTAVGEVIRKEMANGVSTVSGYWTGVVRVIKSPGVYRNLATSEGSKVNGPTSANNDPTWTNLSVGTYNGNLKNGRTGAKKLDLPLVSAGATPLDLIRRAPAGESTTGTIFSQRYFGHPDVSLRILLSDTAADITGLPSVTSTAPVLLSGNWNTAAPNNGVGTYGPVDATHPPIGRSPGPSPMGANTTGTVTTTGSTYSSGVVTLMINATPGIPTYFRIPTLTATGLVAGVSTSRTINCTGRTATTFTGCVWSGGANVTFGAGVSISGTVTSAWYPHTANATAAPFTTGAAIVTLTSTGGTSDFAQGTMFVNDDPVTCTGYTIPASGSHSFTGCTSSPAFTAAPASGLAVTNGALMPAASPVIGGYIKVDQKWSDGTWHDVTMEILNRGIGAPNQEGKACGDPTPTAILRMQRLRDSGVPSTASSCGYAASTNPTDWWPQVLYDPREGNLRDNLATTTPMYIGGLMHYIAIDLGNLKAWLAGTGGGTGTQTYNNNGYVIYFSDRRNNRNAANAETGEYGYEDIVNSTVTAGTPNGTLDAGEDVNGDGVFDMYGGTPTFNGSHTLPGTFVTAPFTSTATPRTSLTGAQARPNGTLFFRRALKLTNGGIVSGVNNLPASGLTVATENPVYVEGNYNATATSVTGASVPAAILADSLTILSNNWKDITSFNYSNNVPSRPAINTGYRFGVVTGKGLSFPWPSWSTSSGAYSGTIFGTDGGVGNFLRYLEDWNASGRTILYKGSLVSLYNSRQATGTYKCCVNVYSYGTRNYSFDTNFLTPTLLPPGTPMFRDVNTLTFRQLLRPTQ